MSLLLVTRVLECAMLVYVGWLLHECNTLARPFLRHRNRILIALVVVAIMLTVMLVSPVWEGK